MTLVVRPITEDERPQFRRLLGLAFGFDPTDEGLEAFNATLKRVNHLCLRRRPDDRHGSAFSLDMTVPAGCPVAGTTMVSVLATTAAAEFSADDAGSPTKPAIHGDVMAALWASESSIYGSGSVPPLPGSTQSS